MFRRTTRNDATAQVIALGQPLTADFQARLGRTLADGHELAAAARAIRTQREYQRWRDALLEWRAATTNALETGFPSTAARDALLEIWSSNAPLCTTWLDSLRTDRATLSTALDFADRVRKAIASPPELKGIG
jgi:hypothetical protein